MQTINKAGIDLIQSREKCKLAAYPDPKSELADMCIKNKISIYDYRKLLGWQAYDAKRWTIGWGDTIDVTPGMVITQKQADERFAKRIDQFVTETLAVCKKFSFMPNENQLAAMVSFVYNLGVDDLTKCLKNSNFPAAGMLAFANRMLLYCNASGKVSSELVERRTLERELFLKPVARV